MKHHFYLLTGFSYLALVLALSGCVKKIEESSMEVAQQHDAEYENQNNEIGSSTRQARIGLAEIQSGRYDKAIKAFEEITDRSRISGDNRMLAAALVNLGNAKSYRGEADTALNDFLESAEIASEYGLHDVAARAFANAAKVEMAKKNVVDAEQWLASSLDHARYLADSRDKAELMLGLGFLYCQSKLANRVPETDWQTIRQTLYDGLNIARSLGADDLSAYGYGYLGMLYFNQGRLEDALSFTSRAAFIAQSINRSDILYRWQWQIGRIQNKLGARDEAIAAYRQAVLILQPVRQVLSSASTILENDFRTDEIYIELADLLLNSDELTENELLEIRNIVEQGKTAELENYFRDDCVIEWVSKSTGIDSLASRTAAIYPIMLQNRLELLVSFPDGFRRYTVYADRNNVLRSVKSLREKLENRGTFEFLPYAQTLYDLLITPISEDLTENNIETLVFVPDAAFRTIPIAALHDGRQYLIQRFAVATSPGLTLTAPEPFERDNANALVVGLSLASQGFAALPNVRHEILNVAQLFPSTLLEDDEFLVDTVRQRLMENPYRIVHIASHGQFEKKAANTFVLAADGKITLEALSEMIGVNRYRDNPIELLTLSACQTAAGDTNAALGLAGIAVKAGARSAIASLWLISDSATTELIAEFYSQFKKIGVTKAHALRKAQLLLIEGERYEHPGYWAPFLMIGNWL